MPEILVVEDSQLDQRVVGGLLHRSKDLHVEFVASGEDALAHLRNNRVNLVLTDLILPGMDGFDLTAAIVREFPQIPVVLMTGKGSEEVAVQALKAGASSYVPKSALPNLLLETVANLVAALSEKQGEARLMNCLEQQESTFVLGNDARMIPPLISYFHRCICGVGLCDDTSSIRVCVALEEALNNAMFHGNLELSSTLRENDLFTYRQLVEERKQAHPFRERCLYVDARISPRGASFVIRDEGPGFDPDSLPDPTDPANLEKPSGRGLLLMKTFMDEVRFNELGNEVTLVKHKS